MRHVEFEGHCPWVRRTLPAEIPAMDPHNLGVRLANSEGCAEKRNLAVRLFQHPSRLDHDGLNKMEEWFANEESVGVGGNTETAKGILAGQEFAGL